MTELSVTENCQGLGDDSSFCAFGSPDCQSILLTLQRFDRLRKVALGPLTVPARIRGYEFPGNQCWMTNLLRHCRTPAARGVRWITAASLQ